MASAVTHTPPWLQNSIKRDVLKDYENILTSGTLEHTECFDFCSLLTKTVRKVFHLMSSSQNRLQILKSSVLCCSIDMCDVS